MSEDVSLESLLQKKAAPEETPAPAGLADAAASTVIIPETMSTQNSLSTTDNAELAAQQERPLTPEEQAKVEQIRQSIDFTDTSAMVQYGTGAQKDISSFSDDILSKVRSKDTGEAGELMRNLLVKVNDVGVSDLTKNSVFGSVRSKLKKFSARYQKMEGQIDEIANNLDKQRVTLLNDINMYDTMYQKNLDYFKELDLYIRAGKEELQHVQTEVIPKLREQVAQSTDPMAPQVVKDYEDSANRFEKKLYDLELSRTISLQMAPQIRLIQSNDRELAEKIQTSILNTIPIWKNQIVLAIGLARQKEALEMQRAVTDTTNELLKKNAELLKQQSVDVAKESERGIVDIETLEKVNTDLIDTINETIEIHKKGHEQRMAAEQKLVQIEGDLKKTLLQNQQS
jgi:uncharacterized protein YaaN involved in tellurite resistance